MSGPPLPLKPRPLPQAEMQLLLLVSLLLAPAPGSSVSAALPGPGTTLLGKRERGPRRGRRLRLRTAEDPPGAAWSSLTLPPTPGGGDYPRRGPRSGKMGWGGGEPSAEPLQK